MDWDAFPKYDVLWTDPPWGQRMVNWFQNKLYKDTGRVVDRTIEELLYKLGELSNSYFPLFVEYSVAEHEMVLEIMSECGHTLDYVVKGKQQNNDPFVICVFNSNYDKEVNPPVEPMKGFQYIEYFLNILQPKIVFDPFSGIGKTKKKVESLGFEYIGSELNEKRKKKGNL